MTQHVVREANADDATALANLYADSLGDAYAGVALPESAVVVDKVDRTARFRSTIADGSRLWLVAIEAASVVGFCGLAPARDTDLSDAVGELTTIAVSRRHRACGYGRALLDAALGRTALRGWSEVVLWVVETNRSARAFYERAGFRCDGASRVDRRLGIDAPLLRYRFAAGSLRPCDSL